MKERKTGRIFLCLMIFAVVCFLTAAGKSEGQRDIRTLYASKVDNMPKVEIVIPTVEEVKDNGYPTNEIGQTYGPDTKENVEDPDLILVCNEYGQEGYVKKTDFDDGVITLEQAANHKPKQRVVNMYLHDGVTIIGKFTIG